MKMNKLQLPYRKQNGTTLKALVPKASCDGLILFQDKYDPHLIYISNPVTNYFQPLPRAGKGIVGIGEWGLARCKNHKFKVFAIYGQLRLGVLILNEKTPTPASWKSMSFAAPNEMKLPFRVFSQLYLFQEEMHWLTMDVYSDNGGIDRPDYCYCIYSVDVNEHSLKRTRIPPGLLNVKLTDKTNSSSCKPLHLLSEVQGSLCVIFVYQYQLQMFVLENRDECLWRKLHTIHLQSLNFSGPYLQPTSFYSDQVCLVAVRGVDNSNLSDLIKVLIHDGDALCLFDSKNQETKLIGTLSKDHKLCTTYYLHSNSLVSLTS
ncbi:hypothetical protein ACHQM5_001853 [Ranunculus cassubicifolius]